MKLVPIKFEINYAITTVIFNNLFKIMFLIKFNVIIKQLM